MNTVTTQTPNKEKFILFEGNCTGTKSTTISEIKFLRLPTATCEYITIFSTNPVPSLI